MGLKGDPDFTFHSSRYTHITRLLENGVPPHVVMKWVGHSKIETTMMYCTQKDTLVAGCAGAITKHPATARNNSPEATTNETVQRDLHINGQWKQNKFGKKK